MRWYWVASFILHALVLGWCLKGPALVTNPKAAVSIVLSRPLPAAAPSRSHVSNTPRKLPTQKPSEESALLNSTLIASPAPEIFEIGNVTVLPKILKEAKVIYPLSAKQARVEGDVLLTVVISAEGSVQETRILKGPGFGLNEAAESALKSFRFSPAERNGEKVPVRIQYTYHFKLNEI